MRRLRGQPLIASPLQSVVAARTAPGDRSAPSIVPSGNTGLFNIRASFKTSLVLRRPETANDSLHDDIRPEALIA
jgi:hypothetical protein